MDGQRPRLDLLMGAGFRDQPPGQLGGLAVGHHPADHAAAEDVQDDVEVEVRPFDRAQQLGDVPGSDLIGAGGQQFRLLVLGMRSWLRRSLSSPFSARMRCMVRIEQR